jgi:hypothetical protein
MCITEEKVYIDSKGRRIATQETVQCEKGRRENRTCSSARTYTTEHNATHKASQNRSHDISPNSARSDAAVCSDTTIEALPQLPKPKITIEIGSRSRTDQRLPISHHYDRKREETSNQFSNSSRL